MERGCLWNSFVMVGHIHAFLNLFGHALPALVEAFESIQSSFSTAREASALRELYSRIRSASFSEDVLSPQTNGLAVLCCTGLGWSDLGEPSRVRSLIEHKGIQTTREFRTDYAETDARPLAINAKA
jgi:mannose-1-phosphate guanylyltransferase